MTVIDRLSDYLMMLIGAHIVLGVLGTAVFAMLFFGVVVYFGHLVVSISVLIGKSIKRLRQRQE